MSDAAFGREPDCRCPSGGHTCGKKNPEEELVIALAAAECPECGGEAGNHGLGCPKGPSPMAGETMRGSSDDLDCGSCSCTVYCEGRF